MADLNFQNPVAQDDFVLSDSEAPVSAALKDVPDNTGKITDLDVLLGDTNEEDEDLDLDSSDSSNNESSEDELEGGSEDTSGDDIVTDSIDEFAPDVANFLSSKGLLESIPKDVDLENFTEESLAKVIKHNYDAIAQQYHQKGIDDNQKLLGDKLSPLSQKLLSFNLANPNADDADVADYLTSITNSNSLTKLDVEKDAERIVREYYKSNNWKSEEINEKVVEMIEHDTLQKEAGRVKPKLDEKAAGIIEARDKQIQDMKDYENQMQETLKTKIVEQLNTGKIDDIPLNQDDAAFLYQAIMNNDTTVTVKGKKVEMGYTEALVRHNKYSDKGDIKRLMLGLLIMQKGPGALKEYYQKQASIKEADTMVRQTKFSNKQKSNSVTSTAQPVGGTIKFNI